MRNKFKTSRLKKDNFNNNRCMIAAFEVTLEIFDRLINSLEKIIESRKKARRVKTILWFVVVFILFLLFFSIHIYYKHHLHSEVINHNRAEFYSSLTSYYNDYDLCAQKLFDLEVLSVSVDSLGVKKGIKSNAFDCWAKALLFVHKVKFVSKYFQIDDDIETQIEKIKSSIKNSKKNREKLDISATSQKLLMLLNKQIENNILY